MAFHIVLPRQMDLAKQADLASRQQSPRHAIGLIAETLGAVVHEPKASPVSFSDRVRSKLLPTESLWTLARNVQSIAKNDDVIFCCSEAGGLQLASLYHSNKARPRIVVFVHNVDRPRARFALRLWKMSTKVDLFLACSSRQTEFLRSYLKLSAERVRDIWDHTDNQFFLPGRASQKQRPLIVSVGLEQRDYKTLAAATYNLDIDVRISGFSKDAEAMSRVFPETMPSNMSRRYYEWTELLQLYRDADAVVVSCHENKYAAGVQSLMEAMACKRPVIATSTEGLRRYLDDSIISVRPGSHEAMRAAIAHVLKNPTDAELRAVRGYEVASRRYDMDRYVAEISAILRGLS
jgi:hypothetical protein